MSQAWPKGKNTTKLLVNPRKLTFHGLLRASLQESTAQAVPENPATVGAFLFRKYIQRVLDVPGRKEVRIHG